MWSRLQKKYKLKPKNPLETILIIQLVHLVKTIGKVVFVGKRDIEFVERHHPSSVCWQRNRFTSCSFCEQIVSTPVVVDVDVLPTHEPTQDITIKTMHIRLIE
jgi:hypothetical protein